MASNFPSPARKPNSPAGLRGPAYCLGLGLLPFAWATSVYYHLASAGGLSSVIGFLALPLLLFIGFVIALPAAIILVKRLIQKKVA